MLVIFPLWFAYPKKLITAWEALANVPRGVTEPNSLPGTSPDASYSLSQENFGRFLQQTLMHTPCRSLVVITSLSDKTRYSLAHVALTLQKADMRPLTTKFIHKAGMRVDVYEIPSWSPSPLPPIPRRFPEAR